MQIKAGFKLSYDVPKPTPMLLTLNLHPSRRGDLLTPQVLTYDPPVETWDYTDGFGNICTRLTAPAGRLTGAATVRSWNPLPAGLPAPDRDTPAVE